MIATRSAFDRTLTALARQRIAEGDGVCLDTGSRQWTLHQLLEEAGRLASGLYAAGVRPGDRVALAAGAVPEHFLLLFAVNRLGAVHVPLNAQWLADEVRRVVEEVEPCIVIVDRRRAGTVVDALSGRSLPMMFVIDPRGSAEEDPDVGSYPALDVLRAPSPFDDDLAGPDDDAIIFYTSGTTGRPKGAVWTHTCLTYNSLAWTQRFGVGVGDVGFGAYDGRGSALAVGMMGPMLAGARLIAGDRLRRGWLGMAESVMAQNVTFWMLAPAMLMLVARDARKAGIDELPSVRKVIMGSAAMSTSILDIAASFTPNAELFNCYGATEGHVSCCSGEELRRKPGAVGRPLPGTVTRIVDGAGNEVPPKTVGHVVVRGPGVMDRYVQQPQLTASVLSDGWWQTGDLGAIDAEGALHLAGRQSESINTGGWTVDAVEVENVIGELPGVERVAVLGRPDPVFGQTVVAYVQKSEKSELTPADIQDHCGRRLARYKNPRRIEFRAKLPVNTNMKVQKRLIQD